MSGDLRLVSVGAGDREQPIVLWVATSSGKAQRVLLSAEEALDLVGSVASILRQRA